MQIPSSARSRLRLISVLTTIFLVFAPLAALAKENTVATNPHRATQLAVKDPLPLSASTVPGLQ
ncbi:MAG: hypothetical protein KDE53_05320, partial [Caldilineaceae bacterium]|nr:hypothetical protein [Caldilineaceae bacterium]